MDAVTFAAPAALWALGLALPLVALHLYRKRRLRIVVAFVPLVRESLGPVRPLGGWRRLFDVAPLLCRLTALAALALALAGPRPASAAMPPLDLVVVLDADVTTLAWERAGPGEGEGATRFRRAGTLSKALARAHGRGRVGLVLAGTSPTTRLPPSEDRDAFDRAVDAAEPTEGAADLAAAIAVARGAATAGRDLAIRVVTSRVLPQGLPDDVTAVGAGSASDDQGFVDVAVAPTTDGKGFTTRFSIANSAFEPRTRSLRVGWRGVEAPLLEKKMELPARGRVDVALDAVPPRGGAVLVATLVGDDVFPRNDVAALVLTPPARPSVLVIHGGTPRPFLRAVLEALGDAVDREASGFVGVIAAPGAAPRDVTIVDGVALPTSSRPAGPTIYLAPFDGGTGAVGSLPFAPGATLSEPLVWRAEAAHPLLRGVDLSTAYVARGTTITGPGVVGLAFVEGAPVVAEGGGGADRWVAFGLDPEGSDLPLRAAFPVLLRNAIRRLAVAPAAPLPPFVRAGEPLRLRHALTVPGPVSLELESLAPPTSLSGGGGPTTSFGVPAPPGGPWLVTVRQPVLCRTVVLDLDPARDVAPARAPSPPPPPAPPPPESTAGRWLRTLLAVAGVALVLDLVLQRTGTGKKVVGPSPVP